MYPEFKEVVTSLNRNPLSSHTGMHLTVVYLRIN